MNGLRPWIEGYLDLNIALVFALVLWFALLGLLVRSKWASAFSFQRRLLIALLAAVLASPFLTAATTGLAAFISPKQSLALSDLAVSAFLNGHITMPAVEFAEILTLRQRWLDILVTPGHLAATLFWSVSLAIISILTLRLCAAGYAIKRIVDNSYTWRTSAKVDILISDEINMPFAARGLRRRFVVLPARLIMQPKNLRLVLAHEFQHIRNGDVELEIIFEALRVVFFWNPAFLILKRQLERFRELSCDQSILNRQNLRANDYARCLIALCEKPPNPRDLHLVQVGFFKNSLAKRDLMRRVQAICNSETSSHRMPWFLRSAIASVMVIGIALGVTALHPSTNWTHDRLMLSAVVNLERLEAINNDD